MTDAKLLLLHSNNRKHFIVCKQMSLGLYKKMLSTKYAYKSYLIFMYKEDLALNNQQMLICHKPNQPLKISMPDIKYSICSNLFP